MPRQAGKSTEQDPTEHPITPGIVTGEDERESRLLGVLQLNLTELVPDPEASLSVGPCSFPHCLLSYSQNKCSDPAGGDDVGPVTHPRSSCKIWGCGDSLLLTQHLQKPHLQLLARNGMLKL